jgi:hypothetical protein
MKLLKNSFLGTIFLLCLGSASIATANNENQIETFDCIPYTLSCGIMGVACDFEDTEVLIQEIRSIDEDLCTD